MALRRVPTPPKRTLYGQNLFIDTEGYLRHRPTGGYVAWMDALNIHELRREFQLDRKDMLRFHGRILFRATPDNILMNRFKAPGLPEFRRVKYARDLPGRRFWLARLYRMPDGTPWLSFHEIRKTPGEMSPLGGIDSLDSDEAITFSNVLGLPISDITDEDVAPFMRWEAWYVN